MSPTPREPLAAPEGKSQQSLGLGPGTPTSLITVPPARGGAASLLHPVLACAVLVIATAAAFRPELAGSPTFWLLVGVPTGTLALYAAGVLTRAGELPTLLRPQAGDLTWGALTGCVLLLISWGVRDLTMKAGGTGQAWLYLIYLQLGDPRTIQDSALLTTTLVLVVAAEELVFRGWVQHRMNQRFGHDRGWLVSGLLFALTLAPTLWTLRAPNNLPNPLLILAGLGCSLTFGLWRRMSGRLLPGLIAHVVFTYFSVAQFRSPGL